jgi:hypothetical protein
MLVNIPVAPEPRLGIIIGIISVARDGPQDAPPQFWRGFPLPGYAMVSDAPARVLAADTRNTCSNWSRRSRCIRMPWWHRSSQQPPIPIRSWKQTELLALEVGMLLPPPSVFSETALERLRSQLGCFLDSELLVPPTLRWDDRANAPIK